MKKTLILLTLCLMAIITGCSGQQLKTSDQGVVINGVCWATRNVAAPGTFADKPEDPLAPARLHRVVMNKQ